MTDFASHGTWIGMGPRGQRRDAPYLRREFTLDGPAASATLLISGLGAHEAWLNGRRVGDHILDPAQTDYDHRVFYIRHDVTDLLQAGANALGVILGDGWFSQDRAWNARNRLHRIEPDGPSYGEPRLLAELRVELADGRSQVVATDTTWRCRTGPIIENNIYAGETYDARLEMSGWDAPGFDDTHWMTVVAVDAPLGQLEEQTMPPMRRTEELPPVAVTEPSPGCFVFDMGQNFAGWTRICVDGPAGREVRLRFAETVDETGHVDTASTGVFATTVEQVDRFTCDGRGPRVWEPRFTYHGFRYVEILGWPGSPTADDVTGIAVHTDLPAAGDFACSDERLNTLHRMALWTVRSNVHGIPEDCPARERCGWLGDANMVAEMSLWSFRARSFWEKYLGDIETTRRRYGGLPGVIAPGRRNAPGNPDWSAAFILVPWYLYLHCGDAAILRRHWDGMRTLVEHFGETADGWILEGGFGDWFDPGAEAICQHTPPTLTTSLWFLRCAEVMARAAGVLDESTDAARYADWPARIRAAIVARFYDADAGTFGSQTADAMTLAFGVVTGDQAERVTASLVADVRARNDHLNTGIFGVRFLLEVLTRRGHGELALSIMHQDTYPGFGHLIGRGATTLWEWWGEDVSAVCHGPRSLNHPMFAGYGNWFWNTLAGMRPDPDEPGFAHVLLEPHPVRGIDWLRAHHDSPRGRIASAWTFDGQRFEWTVSVPDGARATARLPLSGQVRELEPGEHTIVDDRV